MPVITFNRIINLMFKTGTKVKIIGLVNTPQYNKKFGTVKRIFNPIEGVRRIGIELLSNETKCISVKIENLFLPSSVHPNVVFHQCTHMLEYIEDNINYFYADNEIEEFIAAVLMGSGDDGSTVRKFEEKTIFLRRQTPKNFAISSYKEAKKHAPIDVCHRCEKEHGGTDSTVIKMCASCFVVGYCSRECQVEEWPKHKKVCD